TGRISPDMILRAFALGAPLVLIGGCHPPGDCHYIDGNIQCEEMVEKLKKKALPEAGIDPGRLRLEWISSAEGAVFQKVVKEMDEQLAKMKKEQRA
ncbi:MAG: methyl-viologen-reducing hydrogenase subunit delta, partial [Deltaproteobacteria bacterium HGW-Deltaproteobacteria-11]